MADTYGSRDENRFKVNGVEYYSLVDAKTGLITIKSPTIAGNIAGSNADRSVGTISATGANKGKFQYVPGNTLAQENTYFSKPENTKTLKNQAEITANKAQQKEGVSAAGAKARTNELLNNGKANTPTSKDPDAAKVDPAQKAASESEQQSAKDNARKSYDDLKYPKTLQLEYQDCIKFSALQYEPPGLSAQTGQGAAAGFRAVSLKAGQKPGIGNRQILGTVTLPIPGGISDGNSVSWQDDSLDPLSKAFADVATKTITEGGSAGVAAAGSQAKVALKDGGSDAKRMVTAKFAELATGTNNLQQRLTGAIGNPNLELLFTGPSLRTFTFTFRLSPRSKEEAIEVRKIVRFFKQTMTVKRSQSTLLLRSPHTFAIAYLTSNKEHPYLNKFKECALQSCNVSYTPDGNYMSFNGEEPSMTSYEMSLTFKELDPIFDDDYTNLDSNNDKYIGY
jgi:hypothetical protein